MTYRAMFVTDFDGTLLKSDGALADADLAALAALPARGVLRVIATGRSWYSFSRRGAAGRSLPIDYVVVSTGAGVMDWQRQEALYHHDMEPDHVADTLNVFLALDLDFMIHATAPDNHHFWFRHSGRDNPDFMQRVNIYQPFAQQLDAARHQPVPASQFLAVLTPNQGNGLITHIAERLPHLNVVRTTSPLDGKSIWVEVFPKHVSKQHAAAYLADEFGIAHNRVFAVGNDYNDLDLLEWAGGGGFVVQNAPSELRKRFQTVAGNDHGGCRQVIDIMTKQIGA
jgi:Cof subfamily protein (haloacid dehalogenase superfamily)